MNDIELRLQKEIESLKADRERVIVEAKVLINVLTQQIARLEALFAPEPGTTQDKEA
jgi:hypothetical protein